MYTYVCMYIYKHTHAHTHTHARTRTRTRTRTRARAHTHTHSVVDGLFEHSFVCPFACISAPGGRGILQCVSLDMDQEPREMMLFIGT